MDSLPAPTRRHLAGQIEAAARNHHALVALRRSRAAVRQQAAEVRRIALGQHGAVGLQFFAHLRQESDIYCYILK